MPSMNEADEDEDGDKAQGCAPSEEVNLILHYPLSSSTENHCKSVDSLSSMAQSIQSLAVSQSTSGSGSRGHIGLLMAILSSLFFSLCSLIVRKVSTVSALEHSTMRFVGVLLPSICLLVSPGIHRRHGSSMTGTISSVHEVVVKGTRGLRWTLLLRAVLGSAGLIFQFYAFQYMSLADASVLIFSAPVFVTLFARLFLKEPCGPTQAMSVAVTVVGVILISRPQFLFVTGSSNTNLLGAVSAITGTICSANVYILLRKLKTVHYTVIMSSFAAIGVLMSHVGYLIVIKTVSETTGVHHFCLPCPLAERSALLLLGVFSFCGQVLLTKALQLEQAGPVSVCRTADIVFAFIWQVTFLDEVPNFTSVLGAFLVTTSVVVVGLRKWALQLDRQSKMRRRLWFLVR